MKRDKVTGKGIEMLEKIAYLFDEDDKGNMSTDKVGCLRRSGEADRTKDEEGDEETCESEGWRQESGVCIVQPRGSSRTQEIKSCGMEKMEAVQCRSDTVQG